MHSEYSAPSTVRGRALWLALALLAAAPATRAADPQPYQVTFEAHGDRSLDAALRAGSELETLRKTAPASPFALILRARKDAERLRVILEGFGYYGAQVNIHIEGRALDDAALADVLSALPASSEASVQVAVQTGRLYTVRSVAVEGDLPASVHGVFNVLPGAPAVAANILAARQRLLDALQQRGYAWAQIDVPVADVDASEPVIDLRLPVRTGVPVRIGDISFTGLHRADEAMARSRVPLHHGELYDPRKIDAARRDLLALGVFSSISVRTAKSADVQGEIAVTFQVSERKRHAVKLSADYSSDLGGSAGVAWSDRNLRGHAEQLNVALNATNIGGRASDNLGYGANIELVEPDRRRPDRTLRFSIAAVKQDLQAYNVQSATLSALTSRRLSQWWTASAGASLERARITQQGATNNYTLLSLPLIGQYDTTRLSNIIADPLRGWRATLRLAPTLSLQSPRARFVILQANVAAYLDLSRRTPGRSVLALRALAGNAFGAGPFSLPPDQRFYGGGSATVRGYRYQSIGPQFPDGSPAGGSAIAALGAELRQRIGGHFGAAVFVDTGQVSTSKQPFQGTWSVGVGAGVRYYTAIGPIRFDIGIPVNQPTVAPADRFQVYIGLGQAF